MAILTVTDRDGVVHEVEAQTGDTIMEIVRDEGLGIEAICGGQCACATCHCFIDEAWIGKLNPPDEDETDLVGSTEHYDSSTSRLTCQIPFTEDLDGITLTIAPEE